MSLTNDIEAACSFKRKATTFRLLADAQGRDNAEALEAMADIAGIEALSVTLVRRKAFPNAGSLGRGVVEMPTKDAKAIEELTTLAQMAFR